MNEIAVAKCISCKKNFPRLKYRSHGRAKAKYANFYRGRLKSKYPCRTGRLVRRYNCLTCNKECAKKYQYLKKRRKR